MADRRTDPIYRGERVSNLRPKLNRIVEEQNKALSRNAGASSSVVLSADSGRMAILEIVTLDFGANWPLIECCYPGQSGNPSRQGFLVVMPTTLREAGRGTSTYAYSDFNTRVATSAPDSETQYLWPDYRVGDEIVAQHLPRYAAGAADWVWWDMNVDGRQWVAESS